MLDLFSIVPYYTGHLCAGLQQAEGIQVRLASITYQHDPEYFRRQGIGNHPGLLDVTYRLRGAPALLRRPLKAAEYLANMAALLVRCLVSRPHLVHVQFLPLLARGLRLEEWWLRIVKAFGMQVVYTVHNVLPQDGGEHHARAYGRLYQVADRLICHDAEAASRLAARFGVGPERISIIPHGPLFEETAGDSPQRVRERLGLERDECLVLWQGILRRYKGVSFLLKAWQQVCTRNARARLAVVGTGSPDLLQEVREEVRQLGIQDRVWLDFRFVSVAEMADYYSATNILVYPYREITTSGALLTGIVRGKAIVASALPAFQQVLRDGETALLVPYGDVSALSACLLRLIQDPGLRDSLGARLQQTQGGLPRWIEIARQTHRCYRAVLDAPPRFAKQPVTT